MEIQPGKETDLRGFANVRFDSFEELYALGGKAPFFSLEHQRFMSYTTSGLWPGGRMPDNYPVEISIPHNVLARVAGKMMMYGTGIGPREMLITIINYFEGADTPNTQVASKELT